MLGRFKDIVKKYGKVAMGVHFSVSALSITGIYVAINNNVDVESIISKIGISKKKEPIATPQVTTILPDDAVFGDAEISPQNEPQLKKNRAGELVVSSGGALTLALLLNKALFPVRAPITVLLTPAVARFLAKRNLIKNSGLFN